MALARLLRITLLLGLLAVVSLEAAAPAGAAPSRVAVQSGYLADASGQPIFMLGVNYEGPVDRPWHMWDNGQFDLGLIAQDLDRARAANANVVRVFLQQPLADDIRAGKFDELDRFLDLADQRSLHVILTLDDYSNSNITSLAAIAGQVAAHEKGRGTLLALDLKNEPHFGDIALAAYPPGVNVALQDPGTVASVGESVARQDIPAYRGSAQGQQRIPARLNDDQAYTYINVLDAYLQFLNDAQSWATAHRATVVDYMQSPDSAKWGDLKSALDGTLAAWIEPQLNAIRAADPTRLVTLAQVDPFLASLSANDLLDYRTLHRYPTASAAGVASAVALFKAVKAVDPAKPLVLGEFGISNAAASEADSATLEAAMIQAVRDQGGAGALKWMLNDVPNGGNATQDAYGMYRGDGSAKPIVAALKALGTLTPVTSNAPPPQPSPATQPPASAQPAPSTQPPSATQPAAPTMTTQPAPPGGSEPSASSAQRYFAQTGFTIDNDAIWNYFQIRGQIDVFGYPISRTFLFLGCRAQMFQRQIVQVCADGQPHLMNLLDPELFPYTHVNGSTFPGPDPSVKQATPDTADPAYASKIIDFVHATAPDTALGKSVDFGQKFFSTVPPDSDPTAGPSVLPLLDLEVWGAPISKPAADPDNSGFIYQRFQRGIMHYIAAQQTTQTILVADYLKQIIVNAATLPADLKQEAKSNRLFAQYCPGKPLALCRPNDLPGTDLTNAFEPA